MNNLIIFDIDGTLIDITDFENTIYVESVNHILGRTIQIDTNWSNYRYSTDAGVFSEIVEKSFSRAPHGHEEKDVESYFVERMNHLFSNQKPLCQCIRGSESIFDKLKAIGWDVAIATGCWKSSAQLKLKNANIFNQDIPIANSSDCYDRKDIINAAIERAKRKYKKSDYSKIFYVGDKLWDKKAAELLGIGFIGIGVFWNTIAERKFFHALDYSTNELTSYLESVS